MNKVGFAFQASTHPKITLDDYFLGLASAEKQSRNFLHIIHIAGIVQQLLLIGAGIGQL